MPQFRSDTLDMLEEIDELNVDLEFVKLLTVYFNLTEIVLILRAAKESGLLAAAAQPGEAP